MLSILMIVVGAFVALFGTLMVIVTAFSKTPLWGAFSILPLGDIIFGLVEWDDSRMGLATKLLGVVLVVSGVWISMETGGIVAEINDTGKIPWVNTDVPDFGAESSDSKEESISAQESEAINAALTTPDLTGKTMREVSAALGNPTKGSGTSGKSILWFYHHRTVTFTSGVVVTDERHKE